MDIKEYMLRIHNTEHTLRKRITQPHVAKSEEGRMLSTTPLKTSVVVGLMMFGEINLYRHTSKKQCWEGEVQAAAAIIYHYM